MSKPIVPNDYHRYMVENSIQRVNEILFKYPEREFSLSDLARISKVAKSNMGPILKMLSGDNMIEVSHLSNLLRIRARQQEWKFKKAKIVYNLNFIYQSGIVEFLYEHFNHPKAIILFGSFRTGEDASSSDIDIAIESDVPSEYRTLHMPELAKFEDSIGKKIQIHIFSRSSVDIHVFNNIANGIGLAGFLDVKL
jgi:predicted nucleotidyltransferase